MIRKKRHAAAHIPKRERAATSREIRALVGRGYSPAYAARKAYREHERDAEPKRRFHFSLWGRSPGYGHESGWVFATSPSLAAKEALVEASKYSRHKWKLPANVYLQDDHSGKSFTFFVASDGTVTEGQGARDPRRLSVAARKKIPARSFALPARRQLPLIDARHVRNAAARLAQMHKRGTITENEYKAAHARVRRAEKRLGIHPRPVRRHRGKK